MLLDSFWALGACFEVLLALTVMPTLGWRWLLGFSILPALIFVFVCSWLPESARYLAAMGKTEEALTVLQRVAKSNGKPMLSGRLIVDDLSMGNGTAVGGAESSLSSDLHGQSPLRRLLSPELKLTSLLLWFIWLACAFCYYGMVLMSTELLASAATAAEQHDCLNRDGYHGDGVGDNDTFTESCAAGCRVLTSQDYTDLLWTTLAEFPGILLTVVVIEFMGRKKTMAVEFLIFGVTISTLMMVCITSRTVLTIILFISRGVISGVFQAAYVYTPEVYPTHLRSVGVGVCSTMARFGAMVTPFVAQVLVKTSVELAISLYAGVAILAAIASLCLPIETMGRAMK